MNVVQRQAAADTQTKPTDLVCESIRRLLLSASSIAIYYYSARKLFIIIITCFIRCWQNAAKYNHEVGLKDIKSR